MLAASTRGSAQEILCNKQKMWHRINASSTHTNKVIWQSMTIHYYIIQWNIYFSQTITFFYWATTFLFSPEHPPCKRYLFKKKGLHEPMGQVFQKKNFSALYTLMWWWYYRLGNGGPWAFFKKLHNLLDSMTWKMMFVHSCFKQQ